MTSQPDIPTSLHQSTSPKANEQGDENTSDALPSFKLLLQALEDKHMQELAKLRFENDLQRGDESRRCGVQAGDVDLKDLVALFESEEATVSPRLSPSHADPGTETNGKDVQEELPRPRRWSLPPLNLFPTRTSEDDTTLLGRLSIFAEGDTYEVFVGSLILLSVLVMAVELQREGYRIGYALHYKGMEVAPEVAWPHAGDALFYMNAVLTAVFAFDVIFRAAVLRMRFWRVPLNWLDFIAVAGGTFEIALPDALPLKSDFLRLLRLVKLFRAMRVIRFTRVFESLHLLLKSIKASVALLFWSLCLLGIIQCVAGMTISHLVQPYLEDDSLEEVERRSVFRYYGTFANTVLTMFEVLMANWSPACRILVDHVSNWFIMVFLLYRCLIGFAVLNVVTAVFIQQTMRVAAADQELAIMQKQQAAEAYGRQLRAFFHQLDSTGDGLLSWDEFSIVLADPQLLHWMSWLELESNDLVTLFHMIDDGDGEISIDEFIYGAGRLKGLAKSLDVVSLLRIVKRVDQKMDSILQGREYVAPKSPKGRKPTCLSGMVVNRKPRQ